MLFHSPEFVLLMAMAALLVWRFPRARTGLLAAANLAFYAASGWPYLALFLAVASITYWLSLRMVRSRYARRLLWTGVAINLLNLGIFKYAWFAVSNVERFLHLGLDPKAFQLLLPVGISFYTFQLIAYLVDVYREELAPARNLAEFWVFIAFFGQLIAGPIVRGREFLPQIEAHQESQGSETDVKVGAYLFAIGLVKKVVLSDTIGPLADQFFGQAATLGTLEAWIAAYLFAFQIYFDFSAYSDMAVGVGRFFGYRLPMNFRTPYLSGNPSEFWKRWHITLSQWIRDYIYIPLGGSRAGERRAVLALLTAMTLSGFWHGAAWTFILWGIYHGLLSGLHRLWSRHVLGRLRIPVPPVVLRWVSLFLMFQATAVGWVFFRADGTQVALRMVRKMLTFSELNLTGANALYLGLILGLFLLHLGEFWLFHRKREIHRRWKQWMPAPIRALLYTALVVLVVIMAHPQQVTFIYFRF